MRGFRSADLICRCLRACLLVLVLHAHTQARTDESMHLTGVRRSAEWHSGTQALECRTARARARTQKQVPTPVEVLGREQPRRQVSSSQAAARLELVAGRARCGMQRGLMIHLMISKIQTNLFMYLDKLCLHFCRQRCRTPKMSVDKP